MSLDPDLLLAAERSRTLSAEAARHALVRIATCCRPSAWRRTLDAWSARHHREVCCA